MNAYLRHELDSVLVLRRGHIPRRQLVAVLGGLLIGSSQDGLQRCIGVRGRSMVGRRGMRGRVII